MTKPKRASGGFRRLLLQSLFAGAGVMSVPDVSVAAAIEPTDATDVTVEDQDGVDDDLGAIERMGTDQRAHVVEGRRLAIRLTAMSPFDATQIATVAALSANPQVRLAIAEALLYAFDLVGDDVVLDHLSRDEDSEVRRAARRASLTRGL